MTRTCLFHISGNQYPPLPATHHTRRIWGELAKAFDEYHIFARGAGRGYSHTVDGKIHLHLLPAFGSRMWVFMFVSWVLPWFVLRYRPTHLLAQCPVVGGTAAAFCAKVFGIPLVVELHGAHYFYPTVPNWRGRCEFLAHRLLSPPTFAAARRIRSLSDEMTDHLLRVYGAHLGKKVVTIPTRVDLALFGSPKSDYRIEPVLRVVSVGSYVPIKNHIRLIKDLHASGIPFHLTLVGSGPLESAYRETAASLGIADRISLTGQLPQQEIALILSRQDVYVHYALSEAFSRAILEAMAVGLPVVAPRVGFMKDVLRSDASALVLEHTGRLQLALAIGRLCDSEDLRRRLGETARDLVIAEFAWDKVFERYRSALVAETA